MKPSHADQRKRYRAKITAAIALYAASMPDHEPETNDDDESGAPSFEEPDRQSLSSDVEP